MDEVPGALLQTRRLEDLKEHPENPRRHNPDQIEAIAKAIQKFGYYPSIVIDEDNTILKGHGTRLALLRLGQEAAKVIVRDDFTEEEKYAFLIADNQLSTLSEWDYPNLRAGVQILHKTAPELIPILGFEPVDLQKLLIDAPPSIKRNNASGRIVIKCPACGEEFERNRGEQ
jgi:ParB-like chromosome segregation protein Spo0J